MVHFCSTNDFPQREQILYGYLFHAENIHSILFQISDCYCRKCLSMVGGRIPHILLYAVRFVPQLEGRNKQYEYAVKV